jgi:hypothetical protein
MEINLEFIRRLIKIKPLGRSDDLYVELKLSFLFLVLLVLFDMYHGTWVLNPCMGPVTFSKITYLCSIIIILKDACY